MTDIERQIEEEFLAVRMRPQTMLFYTARTAILEAVRRETADFAGKVLDVGCGFMPYRKLIEANPKVEKYVGMDLSKPTYYAQIEPDLKWDGEKIPLESESVESVMATEFLEHYAQPAEILREIRRVMKPNSKIFATVPFVWNLHEVPYDEYRYTPFSLERLFREAGFRSIEIKALGGWNRALAQMIGLWLTFARMSRPMRGVLKIALFPFYWILIKTDRTPEKFDGWENSMTSGLSVTARK